ncbi:MAG: tRNA (N6-isopentenyl adenosine(37)-C2)-methylthiotransferase MiaB [bacterium]
MQKKAYIRTFGCQMNVKDSERMRGLLEESGYVYTNGPEEADLILVNTCSVREKPENKLLGALGRLKSYKDHKPGVLLGVCGCVAQRLGESLLEQAPYLDLILGTQRIHEIKSLVERAGGGEQVVAVDWLSPHDQDLFQVPQTVPGNKVTAFVSIMQGCDNYCAYCIVPYVRGAQLSRRADAVLSEVENLAGSGVKEVTLLGQNVNSYQDRDVQFPDLLRMAADVPGIERVRFTTSHPKDLSDRLIEVMASHPRIMEHIHLPVQAGSDRVLSLMNRGYTRNGYLRLIEKLREAMPEIGITADLMVGFPGESEDDFLETLDLLERVRFDETFSFRYSIRPGTAAADFSGQVEEQVKYDRLYRLQALQERITQEKNEHEVGRFHEVLVEGPSKTDPSRMTGRSRTNRLVHLPAAGAAPGELKTVRVTRALKHSLEGGENMEPISANCIAQEETCLWK